MSENGRCPNCGAATVIDRSREVATCKYCGSEISIAAAVQKIQIDGITTFDSLMLAAERAVDYEQDFDKAAQKYRQALNIKPDDHRALWGLFLCELEAIKYACARRGYVKVPGDKKECVYNIVNSYARHAADVAPPDTAKYYEQFTDELLEEFNAPAPKKKGCYIATAVYGSYDCPEVWTLRRYRDFKLQKSVFGRAFIRFYYAVAPTAVRLFGNSKRINAFIKKRLDKKVAKLRECGYADTPYND